MIATGIGRLCAILGTLYMIFFIACKVDYVELARLQHDMDALSPSQHIVTDGVVVRLPAPTRGVQLSLALIS